MSGRKFFGLLAIDGHVCQIVDDFTAADVLRVTLSDGSKWGEKPARPPSRLHPLVQLDEELRR